MSDMELSEFGKELIDLFERHCFAPAPQLRNGRTLSDPLQAAKDFLLNGGDG